MCAVEGKQEIAGGDTGATNEHAISVALTFRSGGCGGKGNADLKVGATANVVVRARLVPALPICSAAL